MQVLPFNIRKYFSPFLITAVAVVCISMFISVIENCILLWILYFGNKVEIKHLTVKAQGIEGLCNIGNC